MSEFKLAMVMVVMKMILKLLLLLLIPLPTKTTTMIVMMMTTTKIMIPLFTMYSVFYLFSTICFDETVGSIYTDRTLSQASG